MLKAQFQSKKVSLVLLIFGCLVCSAASADAQIKRRKTHRKKTVVRVVPSNPVPADAVVVSRADDFQNENRTLEPEPETVLPTPTETPVPSENSNSAISELNARIKTLENKPSNEYDQKQKRLLLNLDILTRAETRAESLRKQLFEMIEKESQIREKLDQIENDSREENIDRSVAFAGTLRPEELRDMRAKNLASEKTNLGNLMTQIQETRANLEANVQRADQLVEKLRSKLEKDIDDALTEEPKN